MFCWIVAVFADITETLVYPVVAVCWTFSYAVCSWVVVLGRSQAVCLETAADPLLHLSLDSGHNAHWSSASANAQTHSQSVVWNLASSNKLPLKYILNRMLHWVIPIETDLVTLVWCHSGGEKQVLTTCGLLEGDHINDQDWHSQPKPSVPARTS